MPGIRKNGSGRVSVRLRGTRGVWCPSGKFYSIHLRKWPRFSAERVWSAVWLTVRFFRRYKAAYSCWRLSRGLLRNFRKFEPLTGFRRPCGFWWCAHLQDFSSVLITNEAQNRFLRWIRAFLFRKMNSRYFRRLLVSFLRLLAYPQLPWDSES